MIKIKIFVILLMYLMVFQHVGKYSSGSFQYYLDWARDFPPMSTSLLKVFRFHIHCSVSGLPYTQISQTIGQLS